MRTHFSSRLREEEEEEEEASRSAVTVPHGEATDCFSPGSLAVGQT